MNTGTLLVATPSVMGDVNFHRAVVLLVNHKDSGSIGFIINKKIEYTLDEVMDGVQSKQPLYFGGPVEPDNLFYLRWETKYPTAFRSQNHYTGMETLSK